MTEPDPSSASDATPDATGDAIGDAIGDDAGRHSVLDRLARGAGGPSRISLPDAESGHESTPVTGSSPVEQRTLARSRGSYQLLGEIARGGMGIILRGHDYDLGRDVAIKLLDEKLAGQPQVLQRFVEEAQIGGQLQHPGIVPVYELGLMADERPFFAMKLVKGRTLSALLAKRPSVDDDLHRFLSIFEQVCQTVAYAHSRGVVHRDLKPANIMVGAFGEVQVVDWGLAKVLARGGVADEQRAQVRNPAIETVRSGPHTGSESIAGAVMGTPAYMPPEQARGEVDALDERADVFALGAILCEILSGQPPYLDAEGAEPVVLQAAQGQLGPARERLGRCQADPELVRMSLECLAPDAQARPSSADAVASSVRGYLGHAEQRARAAQLEATAARVRAGEERKARRLTAALALAVLLLLATVGAGTLWADRKERARLADLRRQVDDAHRLALEDQAAERWEPAFDKAREALALVASQDGGEDLADHAARFSERARGLLEAARDREQVEIENRKLFERLDSVAREAGAFSAEERDRTHRQAFLEYGLDLESDDLGPALDLFRARGMGEALALRLDEWARLKRAIEGWDSPAAVAMTAVAADLDPDPLRTELRQALMDRDRARLLEFATPENARRLPPATVTVLLGALEEIGYGPENLRLLIEATVYHPSSYGLQVDLGESIRQLAQTPAMQRHALEHLAIARALRPDDLALNLHISDVAFQTGDYLRAGSDAYRLAEDFGQTGVYRRIGLLELRLGQLELALEAFELAIAEGPLTPRASTEYQVVRAMLGQISTEEYDAFAGEDEYARVMLAWILLFHPREEQRDPARALEVASAASDPGDGLTRPYLTVVASHEVGDHELALAILDDVSIFEVRLGEAWALASVAALSSAELGHDADARLWLRIAGGLWNQLTGNAEAWSRAAGYPYYVEAQARIPL